jgi:hypothetical protein
MTDNVGGSSVHSLHFQAAVVISLMKQNLYESTGSSLYLYTYMEQGCRHFTLPSDITARGKEKESHTYSLPTIAQWSKVNGFFGDDYSNYESRNT